MKRRFLKLRGHVWWFQMAIPENCQTVLGKKVVYENLRTSDEKVAQALAFARAGHWKQQFGLLSGSTEEVTPSRAFDVAFAKARRQVERIEKVANDEEEAAEASSLLLDFFLDRHAKQLGYADASEIKEGDLSPEAEAEFHAIRAAIAGNQERPKEFREPFSRTAEGYLAERQRARVGQRLTAQTVSQMEAVYRLFASQTKDAPLATVTRRGAAAFFDKLRRLDANWGRSPKTKERSLDDLLALSNRGDVTPLSDRTLFRYMIALDQVWQWSRDRGDLEGESPFARQVSKGKADPKANAPWSDGAIASYLSAVKDESEPGRPDPFYWLPRIALLSGMRLDEICSLSVEDVKKAERITYFDITDAKTTAGERVVPVHRDLRPFLKLAPSEGFLFPELLPGGPDAKRSWNIGKRLGRRFAEIPGGSTFHAFRKNVTGTFDRHRIRESDTAQIVGHGKKGITYRVYSPDGLTIRQKAELIALLHLPKAA